MGVPRFGTGQISSLPNLLVLNITRYEKQREEEESLLSAFTMGVYGDVLEGFNRLDDASLLKRKIPLPRPLGRMCSPIAWPVWPVRPAGRNAAWFKEAFQEIIRAILINERVYAPAPWAFAHGMGQKLSMGSFRWTRCPRMKRKDRKPEKIRREKSSSSSDGYPELGL